MKNIRKSLHSKVHSWADKFGFKLNASQTDKKSKIVTNHYFYETFNFIERRKEGEQGNVRFLCFDAYGEKITVRTLLDLQTAFFENISQLK
jgi:hypothetical protein